MSVKEKRKIEKTAAHATHLSGEKKAIELYKPTGTSLMTVKKQTAENNFSVIYNKVKTKSKNIYCLRMDTSLDHMKLLNIYVISSKEK